MRTLYHPVPTKMRGKEILPLNMLKERYPDLYGRAALKYKGREWLPQQKVLPLDCLWGDVVFTTAVHPTEIKEVMIKSGLTFEEQWDFFEIDSSTLRTSNLAVYWHRKPVASQHIPLGEMFHFAPSRFESYTRLPARARSYWKECAKRGTPARVFGCIPHILHKGPIDTSSCKVIRA